MRFAGGRLDAALVGVTDLLPRMSAEIARGTYHPSHGNDAICARDLTNGLRNLCRVHGVDLLLVEEVVHAARASHDHEAVALERKLRPRRGLRIVDRHRIGTESPVFTGAPGQRSGGSATTLALSK